MMCIPGRKDSGVIFTTVTELPPNERLERNERDRPSGNGLLRSSDETAGMERERTGKDPKEEETRGGEGGKKTKGNGDTRRCSKTVEKLKSRYEL